MGNEGNMTTQSGFSAGAAGNDSPSTTSSAPVDTAATASTAETHPSESPASGGGGGSIPPATATTGAEDNSVAQSEKGSFKLVFNPRTGRNEVISTMPKEEEAEESTETPPYQAQPAAPKPPETQQQPQQDNKYNGNEMLQFAQMLQTRQQQPVNPFPYTPPVPQPTAPAPQPQQAPAEQPAQQDEVAQAKEYYANVNRMAQERAMQEVGITQDELDVAEYSDDQELLDKVSAYKAAIENNRSRIMQDVENIRRVQEAERADHAQAYETVVAFTNEMRKKEPNFDAIDKLMITRVNDMPYQKAAQIVPLLQKLANGQLTMADLPALQEVYNDTRLEFYSKREGVGLAPQAQKPAFVETPGNGGEAPRQTTPLSALGGMTKKQREAAIGQMFGNFFDD